MSARAWLNLPEAPALSFRDTHLPEYRRRLLAVAGRCTGHVDAQVHLLVDAASQVFEQEDLTAWRGALGVLEAMTGGV